MQRRNELEKKGIKRHMSVLYLKWMQPHLMKQFFFPEHWLMNCRSGHCRDSFINLRLYPRFMEWCLIKPHTYKMFFAITGNDYRILMSSETNESAAHTWPLLAPSCITVITPCKLDFHISPCWDPSFAYFHPDAMHIPTLYLLLPPPPFHPLSIFLTGLRSHLLVYHAPPRFPLLPATSSAVGELKDPMSKALSLLSDRPQSQSLPLSGAEVYTHGKLIPVPCLPHIALMSKVVRYLDSGVTFSKDRHTVGSHYTQKQHIERKRWRAAGLMNGET